MSLPTFIHDWLNNRCISDEIIRESGLDWDGVHIIIPVRDQSGRVLFNKYRRDPRIETGPKYKYDTGAHSALYGVEQDAPKGVVWLCEGELDALVLRSHQQHAYSTTGGSSTFDAEWVEHLPANQIFFIIYDADIAGYKGALNTYRTLASAGCNACIVLLPPGQDVTDFFQSGKTMNDVFALAVLHSPEASNPLKTEYDLKEEVFNIRQELATNPDMSDSNRGFYETTLTTLQNELQQYKKPKKSKYKIEDGTLAAVKEIPMKDFIEFNKRGFAKCIFHEDDTPSLKYYADKNIVHCFGCGATRNVIQVYAHQNNLTWKEAFKQLKTKYGK